MAAPIDTSSATSLEKQLYMVALAMVQAELAIPAETRPDQATVTYDIDGGTVAIASTLNTTLVANGSTAEISVQDYL